MGNDLFLGARSSMLVSTGALGLYVILAALCAVFDMTALCAALVFLFLFCLISRLWGEASLREISVRYEGAPAALFPAGEVALRFTVKNDKLLPVLWLDLVQMLAEDAPLVPSDPGEICRVKGLQARLEGVEEGSETAFLHKKFTFVTGGEELTWESSWTARRRGIFYPAGIKLRAGDGFGLTQKERDVGGSDRCVAVYPARQPVSAELFLQEMWEASGSAKGYLEDPTVIKSTRDYALTDPFKRINWRVTARGQKTVVNTFETILPKSVHFILDCESFNGAPPQSEEFEDMLSIVTSLLLKLDEAGIRCGVSLPRSGNADAREIMGAEHTPLEEILFAFAGYHFRELIQKEQDGKMQHCARPSRFRDDRILTLTGVGKFYYICSDLDKLPENGLASLLDPGRTTLLPYTAPEGARSAALHEFTVVGLQTLKRGAGNGN